MPGCQVDIDQIVVTLNKKKILDKVSLFVKPGTAHAIVGESGSGKTTLGKVILGLVPPSSGRAKVDSIELPPKSRNTRIELAKLVGWIPQDAIGSLDPLMKVKDLILEVVQIHKMEIDDEYLKKIIEMVELPSECLDRVPFHLSGGQCQRVCIARALAHRPSLIVADEPTSFLDPGVQADILEIFIRLKSKTTIIFITHQLGLVRLFCDYVSIMKDGRVIETGKVQEVLQNPKHPYTYALIEADKM